MKHDVKLPPRRAGGAAASSSSPAMGAHRWSHAVAKAAPPRKIRIVHVLAPEIIKTDVENFRDVVQRLTGKPAVPASDGDAGWSSASEGAAAPHPDSPETASREVAAGAAVAPRAPLTVKAEVKEEAETPPGGLLRAFGDGGGDNDMLFPCIDDLLVEDFLCSSFNMDGLMSEF